MLHEDVLMADIDVDQWRNAQALLLRSAKTCRRLVVIHDSGRVVKFRHTQDTPVRGRVAAVDDPHRLARGLYEANRDVVDFVVVMERDAVDTYFAEIQDSWDIEEDLDVFVRRTYATLDGYADGIVTYPGRARDTLGLQWRIGASHEDVVAAVEEFVTSNSTVVLGVEREGELWTSLILDFDDGGRVTSITTVDPSSVEIRGTHGDLADRLAAWVQGNGKEVSLVLVAGHDAASEFLAAPTAGKRNLLAALLSEKRATCRGAAAESIAG
jgi:hypothetical protein